MDLPPEPNRELILLEQIERDPDITQASMATQLGVAVGTVNWHVKRLIAKGYVK
jgi:predicted transcriptional regulator